MSLKHYLMIENVERQDRCGVGGSGHLILRGMITLLATGAALGCSAAATAEEVSSYTYDALGRLVGTTVESGLNEGLSIDSSYDSAGNRTTHAVSGAPPSGGSSGSQNQSSIQAVAIGGGRVVIWNLPTY